MDSDINILLVDENRENLAQLSRQLGYADMAVIGEAGFGPVAYTWASQLKPDVVMISVEEPVARALKTVETIALGQQRWPTIVISSLSDRESIRKAMRAGADDYVARPGDPEELRTAIVSLVRRQREMEALDASGAVSAGRAGTIIAVFGAKGGIGKTTLSTNLATSLAMESKQSVALVDLDLQFGDVALVMETPPHKTISDMVDSLDKLDADLVEEFLARHSSGVNVLPAPLQVDSAERITPENIRQVLESLASTHNYVVIDSPNTLSDTLVAALDMTTLVFLVTTLEIPCVKRTKAVLDLMKHWNYSEDKVKLIINKSNGRADITAEDVEGALEYPAYWKLPFDRAADMVAGSGGLFVQSKPEAKIAQSILELSHKLLGMEEKKQGIVVKMRSGLALPRLSSLFDRESISKIRVEIPGGAAAVGNVKALGSVSVSVGRFARERFFGRAKRSEPSDKDPRQNEGKAPAAAIAPRTPRLALEPFVRPADSAPQRASKASDEGYSQARYRSEERLRRSRFREQQDPVARPEFMKSAIRSRYGRMGVGLRADRDGSVPRNVAEKRFDDIDDADRGNKAPKLKPSAEY